MLGAGRESEISGELLGDGLSRDDLSKVIGVMGPDLFKDNCGANK